MLPPVTDDARDLAHWEAAEEGAELIRDGEHPLAVHELLRQIDADPGNPYAYYFLGTAFFETGELLKALKAYLQALEIKPDYLGALNGAGWSLHSLGRYREAQRLGRQILLKAKEDPDALHLLGLCHYAMGEGAAATGYLNRFLATRPEIEVAMEVDGLLKVLRGETQQLDESQDD